MTTIDGVGTLGSPVAACVVLMPQRNGAREYTVSVYSVEDQDAAPVVMFRSESQDAARRFYRSIVDAQNAANSQEDHGR